MRSARFITFEGGEGSGKSTQAKRLAARLQRMGLGVTLTREPGGSPFAERLRALLLDPATEPHGALAEALVFYAARADHLEQLIRPALAAGRHVICDRFSDSTRIYQGYAGKLPAKILEALDLIVVQSTTPDLTVIIDIPAEIGLARAALRHGDVQTDDKRASLGPTVRQPRSLLADRFEGRDLAFHKKLREGFLAIARNEPQRCIVVDGQKSPDEIEELIWAAVARLLDCEAA